MTAHSSCVHLLVPEATDYFLNHSPSFLRSESVGIMLQPLYEPCVALCVSGLIIAEKGAHHRDAYGTDSKTLSRAFA